MTLRWLVLIPFLVAVTAVAGDDEKSPLFEKVGHVEHHPINEMSGIAKSCAYSDVWWVHNDSGDTARLFAIDGKGNAIVPPYMMKEVSVGKTATKERPFWGGVELLLSVNVDWEDVALADGMLYVADVGNNFNHRRDLGVYVLPEPNPRTTTRIRPLRFLPVRFPDQKAFPPVAPDRWHFDCESIFVSGGKLWFLTKHRGNKHNEGERGTKLYRLDTEHTDRENVLTLVDTHAMPAMPTAAALSPSGKTLAVLTVLELWTFEKPAKGDRWLTDGKARMAVLPRAMLKQAEGICWDDEETLRVTNEQRELFRVKAASIPLVKKAGAD